MCKKEKKHCKCRYTGVPKSNITATLGCHASGRYVPQSLIFPFERLPTKYAIAASTHDFQFTCTKSGWQTSQSFMFYLQYVLLPHLKLAKIKFPVALFLDGHRSHLGVDVLKFCLQNQIILVCLFPNSTRKGQPLDLTVNRQVQREFEKAKDDFFLKQEFLTLENYPQVLRIAFKAALQPSYAQEGFRCAGIFPYDFNNVDTSDMFGRDRSKV